ncbi:MAG TPA: hypothetical protein VIV55_09835 [Flavobacterium sp.]
METTKYTFFEQTIIENITLEDYGISNNVNIFEKVQFVYKTFKSEYVHQYNQHKDEVFLFSEWLSGLPSTLTVPFYNNEILENAKENGYVFTTDETIDEFLNSYFMNLAKAFFTLKNNL